MGLKVLAQAFSIQNCRIGTRVRGVRRELVKMAFGKSTKGSGKAAKARQSPYTKPIAQNKATEGGEPDEGRMVYVGGLPFKAEWQELKDHMKAAGEVEFASIVANETGRSRGVGFVRYKTEEEAQNAIDSLNGSVMDGRTITVDLWTGRKPETQKGGKAQTGGGKASSGKGAGMWLTWDTIQSIMMGKGPMAMMGGKGGKGKGKRGKAVMKSGKKSSGKGRTKVPYSELSEEKKEEIRAKHEARAAEEGREEDSSGFHFGTLVSRGRYNGWIKPSKPGKFPADVKEKLKEMDAAAKAKAVEKGTEDKYNEGCIYLRMCDVQEGVKVDKDMKLKFKLYTDSVGVGAFEVTTA